MQIQQQCVLTKKWFPAEEFGFSEEDFFSTTCNLCNHDVDLYEDKKFYECESEKCAEYGLGFTMENGKVKMALDWHKWKAKLEQEGIENKPMHWYCERDVVLFENISN